MATKRWAGRPRRRRAVSRRWRPAWRARQELRLGPPQPVAVQLQVPASQWTIRGASPAAARVRRMATFEAITVAVGSRRCSPDSRYRRYLVRTAEVSPANVRRVLTATTTTVTESPDGGGLVEMGNVCLGGPEAEATLLVQDDWQRRGLGVCLHRCARRAGGSSRPTGRPKDSDVVGGAPGLSHGLNRHPGPPWVLPRPWRGRLHRGDGERRPPGRRSADSGKRPVRATPADGRTGSAWPSASGSATGPRSRAHRTRLHSSGATSGLPPSSAGGNSGTTRTAVAWLRTSRRRSPPGSPPGSRRTAPS